MHSELTKLGLLILLAMLLASCRTDDDSKARVAKPVAQKVQQEIEKEIAPGSYSTPNGPRELSIIDFKGLYNRQPTALDIGRSGEYVFYKLLRGDNKHAVYSAHLSNGKADAPVELVSGEEYNLAYIKAHPSLNECLLITNYMATDGHVHNRVWRVGPGLLEEIRYESFSSFPATHPENFANSLAPFYSWDGAQVIVANPPYGVGLCQLDGSQGSYVAMPDPRIQVSGSQAGPLPDSGLGRLIYMSVWEAMSRDEKCRLFTLDLDDPQGYRLQVDEPFVVYRFSSPDLASLPWILQGSRLPGYEEIKRQPKLQQYDAESGISSDLEIGGHAEFNLEMDGLGRQLLYMDTNKQALVLLDFESGETKQDRRWFSDDARLFIAGTEGDCYVWKKDILMHAFDE